MRNFPQSFSNFLFFHEFNEAEKQEQLQRLRELVIQLAMILKEGKEGGGQRREGEEKGEDKKVLQEHEEGRRENIIWS